MSSSITSTLTAHEIVFQDTEISIKVDSKLDKAGLQIPMSVRGVEGSLSFDSNDRRITWKPEKKLPPGRHLLQVEELYDTKGRILNKAQEIPFYVIDTKAQVDSRYRIESYRKLRIDQLAANGLSSFQAIRGPFVEVVKAVDRKTENPKTFAFDNSGKPVDYEKIIAARYASQGQKYGKLHPDLYRRIKEARKDDKIEVAIWLKVKGPSQTGLKSTKKQENRSINQRLKTVEARFRKSCMRAVKTIAKTGFLGDYAVDEAAPVVYTAMTPGQIEKLAENKLVVGLFEYDTEGIEDLVNSIAIANSDDVHNLGFKGSGVRVAVWESGPDDTSDLVIADFYDSAQTNQSDHSRHTHAIVKNNESGKPKGHAPSCRLYSANKKELGALRWAVKDKLCTVVSQSFHRSSEPGSSTLSFDDIYKDWLVLHYPYPTILQAAGNFWQGDPDNINPPSSEYVNHKGYNSLAVGNHNDSASAMSASSVFRNPSSDHGDRELPEISANGTAVKTVDLTKSGTSMASPAAAGCTALIQSVNTILKGWPEGCRAILLAGARRNVRDNTWWNDVVANTDARDGSGAVDAFESLRITQQKRWKNASATQRGWDIGTLRSNHFGSNGNSTFSYKVKVPNQWWGPKHVKVALAWNSKVKTLFGILPISSQLVVDLDLKIYDSNNNLVGYSGSWDNSYEIAEFEGKAGETYTIKIRRWSGTESTWFGIAWTVTGGLFFVEQFRDHASRFQRLLDR